MRRRRVTLLDMSPCTGHRAAQITCRSGCRLWRRAGTACRISGVFLALIGPPLTTQETALQLHRVARQAPGRQGAIGATRRGVTIEHHYSRVPTAGR
jgi:hypothetical protein